MLPTVLKTSRLIMLICFFLPFPSVFYTGSCACKRSWKLKRSKSARTQAPLAENTTPETPRLLHSVVKSLLCLKFFRLRNPQKSHTVPLRGISAFFLAFARHQAPQWYFCPTASVTNDLPSNLVPNKHSSLLTLQSRLKNLFWHLNGTTLAWHLISEISMQ